MSFAIAILAILMMSECSQSNIYYYGQMFLPNLNISGYPNEINTFILEQKPNYPFLGTLNNTISTGSTFIDIVGEFSSFPTEYETFTQFTWRVIFNLKNLYFGPYGEKYFFIEGYGYSYRSQSITMMNCSVSFAESEPESEMPALTDWNGMVGYVDYPH